MNYQLMYLDEVLTDVKEAKAWYKDKSEGLELRFAQAVEFVIEKIRKMPTAYPIRYKNVRFARTKVFPYIIHFYIDDPKKQVIITAIVHKKRSSSFVVGRGL